MQDLLILIIVTHIETSCQGKRKNPAEARYFINHQCQIVLLKLKEQNVGKCYFRYFELVFKIKDHEFKLNDKLKTEDIENSINGSSDNIKLMQLYRFIENIYTEKSKGFVKTGD